MLFMLFLLVKQSLALDGSIEIFFPLLTVVSPPFLSLLLLACYEGILVLGENDSVLNRMLVFTLLLLSYCYCFVC